MLFRSVLVKPQFEAGRGKVGKGGVLRDPAERERVVREVAAAAVENGFTARAACLSPLPGAEGNREYFLHLSRKSPEGGTGGASGSYEPGFEESLAAAFAPALETGNRTETP